MENILQKKPEEICRDILTIIDNESVNIELEENSKNNLYVFFTNTMYISNKLNNKKAVDKWNKSKVLVMAHECAHSIQNKSMQVINFVLSNLEMILFAIILITRIFFEKNIPLVNGYMAISLVSIIIRWYLEMNATINSVKITAKYMLKNKVNKDKVKELVNFYKRELLKSMPLFILWLFIFKIIRLIIVLII